MLSTVMRTTHHTRASDRPATPPAIRCVLRGIFSCTTPVLGTALVPCPGVVELLAPDVEAVADMLADVVWLWSFWRSKSIVLWSTSASGLTKYALDLFPYISAPSSLYSSRTLLMASRTRT